ncbi:MAG: HD domain-containing protein [Propionibacteriaceae bacterium]|jgi:dGTPase|nr:HD domain-containing protein [Propionibacteriaceae bacterium]
MAGHRDGAVVRAHADSRAAIEAGHPVTRLERERQERATLTPGAMLAQGAGRRAIPEEPDSERTCFERDRDRIVHSSAFRRLAGKTQVVVYPTDHQRTRLTHALEVAQVAVAVARGIGANAALAEAIGLGHDCGHGPGGHAAEDAFAPYVPGGYEHGPWGADVVLTGLNLCSETLDGIRNHSWSRPAPATVEGEIVSWADRIAYCAHDLEDAVRAGILTPDDIPEQVAAVCGRTRRDQIRTFVQGLIATTTTTGQLGLDQTTAQALARLRAFNYQRIYTRPESVAQSEAVIEVLRSLVDHYAARPERLPPELRPGPDDSPELAAVTYVAGMTDRFAFDQAANLVGWDPGRLPPGLGRLG